MRETEKGSVQGGSKGMLVENSFSWCNKQWMCDG